jgi:hypothetical protein
MDSSLFSAAAFFVLMEKKDNKQEKARNNAIIEVNSSITLVAALSVICNDVMTNRQNPRRFADVDNIC